MTYKFVQNGDTGNFHIEVDGQSSSEARYESVAIVQVNGEFFFGVSDFYNGLLPTNVVLRASICAGQQFIADPPFIAPSM